MTAPGEARVDGTAFDALAERFNLPDAAPAKLKSLVQLLVHDPSAPTGVRDPRRAVDDHIADSLVALEVDAVRSAREIADLGAGAGLPGLPLAIALPDAHVALVESSARKCNFIGRAAAACALDNARVVNTRVESWADGLGRFDVVTARALAPLPVVLEYAAPLMRVGGMLVAWRGRIDPGSEADATRAAAELGLRSHEMRQVHPYPKAQHRHLYLALKVMETPSRFPRRPGVATKRPLGTG
jgi:16S rRNA (guanine527-N7)-methyltransferase